MHKMYLESFAAQRTYAPVEGMRIGQIEAIDDSGRILVGCFSNNQEPVEAQLTSSARDKLKNNSAIGKKVLLAFENNDPRLPIIVDTLYSLLDEVTEKDEGLTQGKPKAAVIDGQRITFDAREEIVLKCGDASITLTKAGKVLIKGAYVSSRSSGANRIKGGTVTIN